MLNPIMEQILHNHLMSQLETRYLASPEAAREEQIDELLEDLAEQEEIVAGAQAEIKRFRGELRDLRRRP